MANEKHLYLIVGGRYTGATEDGERWQLGVRLALVFGNVDPIGNLPSNWDVTPESATDTDGDWTYTTQFGVDGPLGNSFNAESYMHDYAVPSAQALIGSDAVSTQCLLDYVKVSPINTDGHVIDVRTAFANNPDGDPGTQGGGLLPLQNAVVVSTRTPVVGAHGRGRFYMPALSPNMLQADGSLATASVTDVKDAAQAFLEGLSYSGVTSSEAHVRPIVTGGSYTKYGMITSIRVGNRVDTQRRRRAQLVETYVSQDLSYG